MTPRTDDYMEITTSEGLRLCGPPVLVVVDASGAPLKWRVGWWLIERLSAIGRRRRP